MTNAVVAVFVAGFLSGMAMLAFVAGTQYLVKQAWMNAKFAAVDSATNALANMISKIQSNRSVELALKSAGWPAKNE